jgi:energy-coupling factor transporter transmembrane protein EcfT
MTKFLLPFQQDDMKTGPFSSTSILISTFAVALMIAVQADPLVVLAAIFMVLLTGLIAGTRWRTVLSLAAKFELVVLFWIFFVPFLYGNTVVTTLNLPTGPVYIYQEGIEFGVLIGLRMMSLILLFLIALSQMTLTGFMGALRTLRVPSSILGSLLIMLRYVPLFIEERKRMQDAQSLRGLERGTRGNRIRSLGFMVGSNIDRAFDRSISVYESMKLRGFGGKMVLRGGGFKKLDAILLVVLILLYVALFIVLPNMLEALII